MATTELIKKYSDLILIPDYTQRYLYLKCTNKIGDYTFAAHRYLNQAFYASNEWRSIRDYVIDRDNACDMAMAEHDILGKIIVHHINPITVDDLLFRNPIVLDPENLVCVKDNTHKAIHYGNEYLIDQEVIERKPNDTCPWRKHI